MTINPTSPEYDDVGLIETDRTLSLIEYSLITPFLLNYRLNYLQNWCQKRMQLYRERHEQTADTMTADKSARRKKTRVPVTIDTSRPTTCSITIVHWSGNMLEKLGTITRRVTFKTASKVCLHVRLEMGSSRRFGFLSTLHLKKMSEWITDKLVEVRASLQPGAAVAQMLYTSTNESALRKYDTIQVKASRYALHKLLGRESNIYRRIDSIPKDSNAKAAASGIGHKRPRQES